MLIDDNGTIREMTADEIAALPPEPETVTVDENTAFRNMAVALSTANSLAQMRSAAQNFLNETDGVQNDD